MRRPLNNELPTGEQLAQRANAFRLEILEMAVRGKGGHLGGSYSVIDVLTTLYYRVLSHDPSQPDWPDRDRLIFSKGHSCLALYCVLADLGYFPKADLETYYLNDGHLAGHPTFGSVTGVEATTGSLGHGLSISVGMAMSAKLDDMPRRVFTILGDGECNEGSVWEAFASGAQFKLDNLTAIVDCNGYESLGTVDEIMSIEPLGDRLRSFGWAVAEIDGHDFDQLIPSLENIPLEAGKPTAIISRTAKGKGVSFMENVSKWHYRAPSPDEAALARTELKALIEP